MGAGLADQRYAASCISHRCDWWIVTVWEDVPEWNAKTPVVTILKLSFSSWVGLPMLGVGLLTGVGKYRENTVEKWVKTPLRRVGLFVDIALDPFK
jgi:hypothetical protein